MHHRPAQSLFLVLVLTAAAVLVTPALAKGTVSGHIVDREGNPLRGIQVVITGAEELKAAKAITTGSMEVSGGRASGSQTVAGAESEDRGKAARTFRAKTNKKGYYLAVVENGEYALSIESDSVGISDLKIVAVDRERDPIHDWSGRVIPGRPTPTFQMASGYTITIDVVAVDTATLNEEYANFLLSDVASALESGDRAAALRTVDELLEKRPDDPVGLTLRAYIHSEDGRYEDAESDLVAALEQKPDMVDAKYQLAALYRNTERDEQALALFREVAASSDSQQKARALLNVGEMERDAGNIQAAVAAFEGAVEAMPEIGPQVTPELVSLYTTLGDTERAEALMEAAPSLEDLDPAVQYNIAVAHFNRKEYEEAAKVFRQVIEVDPSMADAHRTLGYSLLNLGQQAEALEAFRKYLELEPDGAEAGSVAQLVDALSKMADQ